MSAEHTDTQTVTLITADGEIDVPFELARYSATISNLVDDIGSSDKTINVSHVSCSCLTLSVLFGLVKRTYLSIPVDQTTLMPTDIDTLIELVTASAFLCIMSPDTDSTDGVESERFIKMLASSLAKRFDSKQSCIEAITPLLNNANLIEFVSKCFGSVYTIGRGSYGCLGHGNLQDQRGLKKVTSFSDMSCALHVSFVSCCDNCTAIIANSKLYTFGWNELGGLGHGDTAKQLIPKEVEGLSDVTHVSCGRFHFAAISNSDLYTFGDGMACGSLGHGDLLDRLKPKKVERLPKVVSVSCGHNYTAAITVDGDLYTFGEGTDGQLGYYSDDADGADYDDVVDDVDVERIAMYQQTPKKVNCLHNVIHVACGYKHTAVITKSGELFTFGRGKYGRLGHGDFVDQVSPKKVQGIHSVSYVACGKRFTIAIANGELYFFGQGLLQVQCVPTKFSTLSNVTRVACSNSKKTKADIMVIANGKMYVFTQEVNGGKIITVRNITHISVGLSHMALVTTD